VPVYIVQQGEHLSSIAEKFGFLDYRTVWQHAANADLRSIRKNPHVVQPGDELFIPDKEQKNYDGATTRIHTFKIKQEKLLLRVLIQNVDGDPIPDSTIGVQVDGDASRVQTKGGMLEKTIMRQAHDGKIELGDDQIPMGIGDLDPVSSQSGQLARLLNLGYYRRTLSPIDPDEWRSAVEEFQCDHDIKPVTGNCDAATQAKLEEVHGC
jgi:hypothetical protein